MVFALKNNRRILRQSEASLVCSLFSLPPSPCIRHWQRSTPSPTINKQMRRLRSVFFYFTKAIAWVII